MAGQLTGKVEFFKVDTDQEPELAQKYGVQGIPTLVLLKDGQEADRAVGYMDEERLKYFATS